MESDEEEDYQQLVELENPKRIFSTNKKLEVFVLQICYLAVALILNKSTKDRRRVLLPEKERSLSCPELDVFHGPLFVTWETLSHALIGCIGTFSHTETWRESLIDCSIKAGLRDGRFSSHITTTDNLKKNTRCKVSFLHSFRRVRYTEWTPNRDLGIRLEFYNIHVDGDVCAVTFLPGVAEENHYTTRDLILLNLLMKLNRWQPSVYQTIIGAIRLNNNFRIENQVYAYQLTTYESYEVKGDYSFVQIASSKAYELICC